MSGHWPGLRDSEPPDKERFRGLYEDVRQDLLAFLLRRCPSVDDAADCLAETFRIAWEKRARIPAGADARPWLFGVARNVSRRERAGEARDAELRRELATAVTRSGALTDQTDVELGAALAELSPLDQEIITMMSWDGLTPREVASILGLSPNVVRVRAHRARQRLRQLLANADVANQDPAPPGAVSNARQRG